MTAHVLSSMMYQLDKVLHLVNEPHVLTVLEPYWDESIRTLGGQIPAFLKPASYRNAALFCGFPEEVNEVLDIAADEIIRRPELTILAWHCYNLLYEHIDYQPCKIRQWPGLQSVLGEISGVFYLLLALGAVPKIQARHVVLRVNATFTRDTCSSIRSIAEFYRFKYDRWGAYARGLHWVRHYVSGLVFRIGRLEYLHTTFSGDVEVYRHNRTKETVALLRAGLLVNSEGYVTAEISVGRNALPGEWTASLIKGEGVVVGHPVSPSGTVAKETITLPCADWTCFLKKGDATLDMHIPSGGNMHLDKCRDSMCRAVEFFKRLFPEKPPRSISCISWIFNNQLQEILPDDANLLQLQREVYLYPVPPDSTAGMWFIFQQEPLNMSVAPRKTNLQRAILTFFEKGNLWRGNGGMFILIDDIGHFGTSHYKSQWPCMLKRER